MPAAREEQAPPLQQDGDKERRRHGSPTGGAAGRMADWGAASPGGGKHTCGKPLARARRAFEAVKNLSKYTNAVSHKTSLWPDFLVTQPIDINLTIEYNAYR